MRNSTLILILAVCLAGCGRPSLVSQIQSLGGFTNLKSGCQVYFQKSQEPNAKAWVVGNTNDLPPVIAALRPQIVEGSRWNDMPMVDIQVSGGFSHHGLMVFLTNTPAEFRPGKSSWRVTQIADGVFEYRE